MNVGPIRRLVGTLGLCALIPIAVLLATGRIAPPDAAVKGLTTLVVVMLIGRVASWCVARMAHGYEVDGQAAAAAMVGGAEAGGHRAGDVG